MGIAAQALNLPAKSKISTPSKWFDRDLAGASIKGTCRLGKRQGGREVLPPGPQGHEEQGV